jgi:endonuclease/exonuclease/phosphatase family metal-dependent hydrolase
MAWKETTNLKLTLLNAENLFLLFDQAPGPESLKMNEVQWKKLSTSIFENKSLSKAKELARSIDDMNSDIVMLCEVGGVESLKNFNELFLGGRYLTALIEGNSDRNIDVGFLIRKELPYYFDLLTNKNRSIKFNYSHDKSNLSLKFSRDAVELRLFQKESQKPFLILLLTHLKSRLDPERVDPNGFERRKAELRTLVEIVTEIQTKYPQVPLIVSGDFNGNASKSATDPEFLPIYEQTQLLDVFEIDQLPADQRSTFVQVKNGLKAEGRQLDYCFLSKEAQLYFKKQSSSVYLYKDEFGFKLDRPVSLDAKSQLPSDHYPVTFELEKLPVW